MPTHTHEDCPKWYETAYSVNGLPRFVQPIPIYICKTADCLVKKES